MFATAEAERLVAVLDRLVSLQLEFADARAAGDTNRLVPVMAELEALKLERLELCRQQSAASA